MQFLELDIDCSKKENIISEIVTVYTDANKRRVIIPSINPFFKKDFKLTHPNSSVPLVEGKDFKFIYRYVDIKDVACDYVYGGVQILNPNLKGQFTVTVHSLGGQYTQPHISVVDYLVNTLIDPVKVYWENVKNRITCYAMDEHTQNWHDFRNSEYIASSIDSIRDAIVAKSNNATDAFDALVARVAAIKKRLDDSHFDQHVANKNNPHRLTVAQVDGVNRTNGEVVNALKVYGKTLVELSQYILQHELNQTELDKCFKRDGTDVLTQRLILDGNDLIIKNKLGTSTLSMKDDALTVDLDKSLVIRSDADQSLVGECTKLIAGANELMIKSHAGESTDEDILFNDSVVLTESNIRNYTGHIDVDEVVDIKHADTATLAITGKGSTSSPLQITLKIARATTSAYGATYLQRNVGDQVDRAIAASSVVDINRNIDTRLDNTVTVNGRPFGPGNFTISKSELDIDHMDNTSPSSKRISNDQQAALDGKANIGHTHHSLAEQFLGTASDNEMGLLKLSNSLNDNGAGWAVTPFAYKDIAPRFEELLAKVSKLTPIMNMFVYGKVDYLPIPASGAYAAAGIDTTFRSAAYVQEKSGRHVFLRPGSDLSGQNVTYFYFDTNTAGAIYNIQSTSTVYAPAWLPSGRTVKTVLCQQGDVMIVLLDNDEEWVVLLNGTLDGSKHVASRMTGVSIKTIGNHYNVCHLIGDWVYIVNAVHNNSNTYCRVWRINRSQIGHREVTATAVSLTGKNYYGQNESTGSDGIFYLSRTNISTDPNAKCLMLRKDNNHWSSACNLQHSTPNFMSEVSDDKTKIRVLPVTGSYYANSYDSFWSYGVNISYVIDVTKSTVMADNPPEDLPVELYADKRVVAKGRVWRNPDELMTEGSPNEATTYFRYGKNMCSAMYYGIMRTPRLNFFRTLVENGNPFDNLHYTRAHISNISGCNFVGNYGSPVHNNPKYIQNAHDDRVIGYSQDSIIFDARYDPNSQYLTHTGFGPTTDRVRLDWKDFMRRKGCPSYHRQGQATTQNGFAICATVAAEESRTPYTTVTNAGGAGQITLEPVSGAAINDKLYQKAVADGLVSRYAGRHMTGIYKFGDGMQIAEVAIMQYNDDTHTAKHTNMIQYQVNFTISNNSIVDVSFVKKLSDYKTVYSTVDIGPTTYTGAAFCAKLPDGSSAYGICSTCYNNHVGNGGNLNTLLIIKSGSPTLVHSTFTYNYSSYGFDYYQELGGVGTYRGQYGDGETLWFDVYGNSYAELGTLTGKGGKVVLSTMMPSGWILYFTQEVQLFYDGVKYTMPVINYDLSTLFPSTHQNRTIYVYIDVSDADTGPVYKLTDSAVSNDNYKLIGRCKTDSRQIREIEINNVIDYGNDNELERHKLSHDVHGLGRAGLTKLGLGNLENGAFSKSVGDLPDIHDGKKYATSDYIHSMLGTKIDFTVNIDNITVVDDGQSIAVGHNANWNDIIFVVPPTVKGNGKNEAITELNQFVTWKDKNHYELHGNVKYASGSIQSNPQPMELVVITKHAEGD